MAKQFEIRIVEEMDDVSLAARIEIIHAQNVVAVSEEMLAEMRPDESSTASDKDALLIFVFHEIPLVFILFVFSAKIIGNEINGKWIASRICLMGSGI